MLRFTGIAFVAFWSSLALGLKTAYVQFDHPEGWKCELAQGVWICQSTTEPDRRESVVLSIATMATEWDTLDNYETYLKQPKTIQDEDGTTITSKVTYARKRNINGQTWVDALHFNSELPGFWSRYVATTVKTPQHNLAILITYIVSEEYYKQLAPKFEAMVSSLKPNADFDAAVLSKQGDGPVNSSMRIGDVQKAILSERVKLRAGSAKAAAGGSTDGTVAVSSDKKPIVVAVLGGAAVVYMLLRRRKKKKPASEEGQEPTLR
jgi:hypothetical protein